MWACSFKCRERWGAFRVTMAEWWISWLELACECRKISQHVCLELFVDLLNFWLNKIGSKNDQYCLYVPVYSWIMSAFSAPTNVQVDRFPRSMQLSSAYLFKRIFLIGSTARVHTSYDMGQVWIEQWQVSSVQEWHWKGAIQYAILMCPWRAWSNSLNAWPKRFFENCNLIYSCFSHLLITGKTCNVCSVTKVGIKQTMLTWLKTQGGVCGFWSKLKT